MSHGTWVPSPGSLRPFAYRTITSYGAAFQLLRLNLRFVSPRQCCTTVQPGPSTPLVQRIQAYTYSRFRLFPVRSPLLRESLLLSFPGGTKMFQFPPFASALRGCLGFTPDGLPHSGISGSKLICSSPELIAAYHALHRLLTPRHPPCALSCLPKMLIAGRYRTVLSSHS